MRIIPLNQHDSNKKHHGDFLTSRNVQLIQPIFFIIVRDLKFDQAWTSADGSSPFFDLAPTMTAVDNMVCRWRLVLGDIGKEIAEIVINLQHRIDSGLGEKAKHAVR